MVAAPLSNKHTSVLGTGPKNNNKNPICWKLGRSDRKQGAGLQWFRAWSLTCAGWIPTAENVMSSLCFAPEAGKVNDYSGPQEEKLKEKSIFICIVPILVRYGETSFLKLPEREWRCLSN